MHDPPPFSYPRAGQAGAPLVSEVLAQVCEDLLERGVPPHLLGPSLVQAYSRIYRRLPTATPGIDKTQTPMLYSLLGSGTTPLKMSPEDAAYQPRPHPSGQSCANCSSSYTNNVTDDVICSQIEGRVSPSAWCRLWNTDRF